MDKALGLNLKKANETVLYDLSHKFILEYRYNVISLLAMPEECLKGKTEQLKLMLLAIRYLQKANDKMIDLIQNYPDFQSSIAG